MSSLTNKIFFIINELTKTKKTFLQMFLDVLKYSSRYGLSPGEYFTYGLHVNSSLQPKCLGYMSNYNHYKKHLPVLNSSNRQILEDKLLFKDLMQKRQIPVPEIIGYYGPSDRQDLNYYFITPETIHCLLSKTKTITFVVKPSKGSQGKGIYIVRYSGDNKLPFNIKNESMTTLGFFQFLDKHCRSSKDNYVLLENVAHSNTTLKKISPDASPNIRIITLKLPNNDIKITSAAIRLGRKNSVTSNASAGGFLASIDVETGLIISCRTNSYITGTYISTHPDTSHPILGVRIPKWTEILYICKKAASEVNSMNSIGWDVLIDNNTPKIIEGNDQWCIMAEQVSGQGYLSTKNRGLLKLYGIDFSDKKTTKPSLRKLKVSLFGLVNKE